MKRKPIYECTLICHECITEGGFETTPVNLQPMENWRLGWMSYQDDEYRQHFEAILKQGCWLCGCVEGSENMTCVSNIEVVGYDAGR